MLTTEKDFILFDTEFTAWEGSRERRWSGPNEYREIVQIGAIKVDSQSLTENDVYVSYVKPKNNPVLSAYFVQLTDITQARIDRVTGFAHVVQGFKDWCGSLPIFSFGRDGEVVEENCRINSIPNPFSRSQFHDLRDFFAANGIATEEYMSSTITRAFGVEPPLRGHDALNDVRMVLRALVLCKTLKRQ